MHWYEIAKIAHFMGLVALFGFFAITTRSGAQLRAATQLSDVRAELAALEGARRMLHSGSGLLLISGMAMIGLRWRGPVPFATVGMVTLLSIWILSAVGARHLRSIRAGISGGNGPVPDELRALILAPSPWVVAGAMNSAAAGVLVVMTWKPAWLGAWLTVVIMAAVGASIGGASVRRQRTAAPAGQLSTAA